MGEEFDGKGRALSMCGIVGYIGGKDAAPIIFEGLKKLEYRGYDSAGIAPSRTDRPKLCEARVNYTSSNSS